MSTLKTTNLQNASASSPAFVLAADGSATANLSSVNGGPIAGSRNRIINGDMRIDQRNAGAAVTVNTSPLFPVDRFFCDGNADGIFTAQRSTTVPAGFTNSVILTVTTPRTSIAAGDVYGIRQHVEGFNTAGLGFGSASASAVTLSFWVRSSVTGTYAISLFNSAFNRSYVATYSISAANTFEYKTITILGDTAGTWLTDNGIGMSVFWDLGSGSNYHGTAGAWTATGSIRTSGSTNWISTNGATFYITGVQLEPGSTATPFERRSYGQELALCQRYLPAFSGANGGSSGAIGTGGFYTTTNAAIGIPFPVQARVAPTGVTVSAAGDFFVDGTTSAACTAIVLSSSSSTMGGVNCTYATTTAVGTFARMRTNTANALLYFTGCEL